MSEMTTVPPLQGYSDEVSQHIAKERERVGLLGEIRAVIFGMQDGVLTSIGVVAALGGAAVGNHVVLIAGFAQAVAGMVSMAAGEYISTKSQRQVYEAEIAREEEEVRQRPDEAREEIRLLLIEEGLSAADAADVANKITTSRHSWLKTMVEKELRLTAEEPGGPLRGAAFMAVAYLLGGILPVVPYLFLQGTTALLTAVVIGALALAAMGVSKALLAERNPLISTLEVWAIGAATCLIGYGLGTLLPRLLGAPSAI